MHARNTVKTYVLLAALGGVFVAIGSLFGQGGALIGLVLGVGIVGVSYWKSDAIAIRSARAVPADPRAMPEYFRIVQELSAASGMPMPRLYVTPDPQPNAFATGRDPEHAAVAVTAGILQVLSWDELQGVLAHELSHVRNRDILIGSVAAAAATAIGFLASMARWGAIFGGFGGRDDNRRENPIGLLAAAIVAPFAAMLIQLSLSRSREFEADRSGAELLGTGEPLARALAKLEAGARRIPMDAGAGAEVHREPADRP